MVKYLRCKDIHLQRTEYSKGIITSAITMELDSSFTYKWSILVIWRSRSERDRYARRRYIVIWKLLVTSHKA